MFELCIHHGHGKTSTEPYIEMEDYRLSYSEACTRRIKDSTSCRSADERTQLCHTRSYSVICWSRLDDYGWTMADGNPISSTIHVNDFPTHMTISQTNQTLFRFRPGCPTDLYVCVCGGGGRISFKLSPFKIY